MLNAVTSTIQGVAQKHVTWVLQFNQWVVSYLYIFANILASLLARFVPNEFLISRFLI